MNPIKTLPDANGHFGEYGGRFVPETLMGAIEELEQEYLAVRNDENFLANLDTLLNHYVGRPTPLYFAENLTDKLGGPNIFLKREDLAHTGAHKINNALAQGLLAKKMGKNRIIAETGAGQHGVATATACALLKLECVVYMGEKDVERQSLNVFRMRLLGAEVRTVNSGSKTLKDAINETIRDWVTNVRTTHYIIGSVVGPHPYPMIVRDFQAVIGNEARAQFINQTGSLPHHVIACVGGGSNAMGLFHSFIEDTSVNLIGVEAAGLGIDTGQHASTLLAGRPGVLHGSMSYLLQDSNGQIQEPHSISAGLDYPGVGPEHSFLKDSDRASYVSVTDSEALDGFSLLSTTEGIIPALEPAHAIYYTSKFAPTLPKGQSILVGLSGRGDKDIDTVAKNLGINM